jgi:predicted N-acyltransferase
MEQAGLRIRKDCQFHWHNRGYADFDRFLAAFSSAKRKKARRERRRVRDAGISFQRLRGDMIDADRWRDIYRLIGNTFLQRGSLPYLNLAFFQQVGKVMPENILVILAEHEGRDVAAAVFFEGRDALYGRYWGSDGHFDSLHFETCYYQGIDYCIETGKSVFEPGTQGEHKISRGFVPVATWSAHWLCRPEFLTAIGRYLDEERRHVDRYMAAVDEHSPYRNEQ